MGKVGEQEMVIEFHRAISSHNNAKVSDMLKRNKELAVTYLTDTASFEEIYNESTITFDGKNDIGLSPIVGVGIKGSAEAARILLDNPIPYHKFDLVKALCSCAVNDNHEVAQEIIKVHKNIINDISPGWPGTPLYEAANSNAIETCKVLLAVREIQVNKADQEGDTPLHIASLNQHTEMIKLLLEQKDVHVNAFNRDGETPIYYTANQKNKKMEDVQLLLCQGADISKKNEWGRAPPFTKEEYNSILDSAIEKATISSK